MILDSRWAFKDNSAHAEGFTFTAATAQTSDLLDLKAAGFFDGGGDGFVQINRSGTYTKNALTNLRVSLQSCDTEGGTYVENAGIDIPVASIDASADLGKIRVNPGLKRYARVVITPTGAPTTITVKAIVATS